jgi:hypothetical protein
MKSNYLVWDSKTVPNVCSLSDFKGVDDDYALTKGVSQAGGFPPDAAFTMDPDFPNHTLLADNLINLNCMIVASKRLKEFLEMQNLAKVEYLPVKIIDHKGRPVSPEYFIIHPIEPVDCLDVARCEPTWSRIDKSAINRVKRLCLNEEKVGAQRLLFKPHSFFNVVLVHRNLAQAINSQGFSGISWIELENFRS